MAELLPLPIGTDNASAGKKFLPSVSSSTKGVSMNWVTVVVILVVAVVVWKFVLKK